MGAGGINAPQHILARASAHQPLDHLRIACERGSIGMVGGQEQAGRIGKTQQQFQSGCPLDGTGSVPGKIGKRQDIRATLALQLPADPGSAGDFLQCGQTAGIERDRQGCPEKHLANIAGDLWVILEALDNLLGRGSKVAVLVLSVGVELDMAQVGALPFQGPGGLAKSGCIAGTAEPAGMQMDRMRQTHLVHYLYEHLDDLALGQGAQPDRLVQTRSRQACLPGDPAARVHQLDRITSGDL